MIGAPFMLALLGAAPSSPPAYAIVIGVNEAPESIDPTLERLRYADDDAVRWYQLLERITDDARLFSVLDEATQRRYPGLAPKAQPPRLDRVLAAVEEMSGTIAAHVARGQEPVFYFVFSGHGARDRDGSAFLTLHDAQLTRAVLYERILAKVPARLVHLVVDACHARGVVGLRGDFGVELDTRHETASSTATAALFPRPGSLPGLGVMVATTEGNQAHEWSELEAGVFTHEMLSGLLGAADVNRDSRIEYSEIEAFIASASRDLRDPRAVPKVVAVPPTIDRRAPLISLEAIPDRSTLVGDARGLGHFFVELANGQRYLDAHLSGESPLSVLLPEQGDLFVRTAGREAEVRQLLRGDAVEIDVGDLEFRERSDRTRGSIERAYREGLFASPFGLAYYRGFIDRSGAIGVPLGEVEVPRTNDGIVAKSLALSAGAAAILAIASGVIAAKARSDFDRTDLQVPAHEAADRLALHSRVSVASGLVSAGLAIGAVFLWPEAFE